MKKYIYIALSIIIVCGAISLFDSNKVLGVSTVIPSFVASNTNYGCTPTGDSVTPLVATTTSRTYIRLTNTSDNTVYLSLGTVASTTKGIPLTNATGTNPYFETNDNSIFGGAIYCYSTSGTSTIAVTEIK